MSKRKQSDILSFFKNKKTHDSSKKEEESGVQSASTSESTSGSTSTIESPTHTALLAVPALDLQAQVATPTTSSNQPQRDIGNYVENTNIPDAEKYLALTKTWAPSNEYSFPCNIESGQQRKFNKKWLDDNPWLSYSKKHEGAYCRTCVLFGPREAGLKKKTALGKLVKVPLTKFKHALEIFKEHSSTEYHKISLLKSTEFTDNFLDPRKTIVVALDTSAKQRISENRKRLIPIVKTVILCGRENIPLRGHRDDGSLDEDDTANEGKFRALLRFRIDAGDLDLKSHLQNAPKNATYISKTTQNVIIDCCGEVITEKIVEELKTSKIFSIIADETRDSSCVEQMTLCLRYLDTEKGEIKEMFVGFVEANDGVTGEKLADLIVEKIQELGLDINDIRGQAYDGGSNMAAKFKGVQARIRRLNPLAMFTHCASHQLNLALTHACSERNIRNASGTIREVINFLKDSPGRVKRMEQVILEQHPEQQKHRLVSLCETRFVERHDAITFFLTVFDSVLQCLMQIDEENPTQKSASLINSIQRFDFIVTLHILGMVLDLTAPLSKDLQSPTLELKDSYDMAKTVVRLLQRYRCEDVFFDRIYDEAVAVATKNDVEIKSPRIVNRQAHRSNSEASTPRDFYRINVFNPFMDTLISEITTRFSETNTELTKLFSLIPSEIRNSAAGDDLMIEEIVSVAQKYCKETNDFQLRNEISLWKEHWSQKSNLPSSAVSAFCDSSTKFYPNIKKILHLLCVLPVTSCTGERTFSSMKLIKTYLRSTMRGERLNGLAIMNIHKNSVDISATEVIDKFGQKHPRRLQLLYNE